MAYAPKLIASQKIGLELDKTPAFLADDAYVQLINCYMWRERIKKKKGKSLLGRLRRNFTTVSLGNSAASPWSFNLFSFFTISDSIGQALVPGSTQIAIGGTTYTDNGVGVLVSSGAGAGTINYLTGAITITGGAATVASTATFSYYPDLPVMGLPSQELVAINAEQLIGFDEKYAYLYNNVTGQFKETPSVMATTWHGGNVDFFYSQNMQGALFTTNQANTTGFGGIQGYNITNIAVIDATHVDVTIGANTFQVGDFVYFDQVAGMTQINGLTGTVSIVGNPVRVLLTSTAGFAGYTSGGVAVAQNRVISSTKDNIRWYATTAGGPSWVNFTPSVNATSFLVGCTAFVYYRNRIVCFDTQEQNTPGASVQRFYQRARWSQNGTAYYANPTPVTESADALSWREDIAGRGGALDAPTDERIVSIGFLKDTLMVFFERSTWRFRYTNNEIQPFQWEKVDQDYGSSGLFSTVLFDIGPITIGSRGIIQTDGNNVLRIDSLIPDEAFSFENANSGPQRIHGLRDFDEKIVYWTFPNNVENSTFPNRMLIYNYDSPSWAIFTDSITCLGYWQSFNNMTWNDLGNITWDRAEFAWNDPKVQALYPFIVGGNQQGYVHVLQELSNTNSVSLYLNNITAASPGVFTSYSHNLEDDMIIQFQGIFGDYAALNNISYQVHVLTADTFTLYSYNATTLDFTDPVNVLSGAYTGAGEIQVVDNFLIQSKQFNEFLQNAGSIRLGYMDFYVDATDSGKFVCTYYIDSNNSVPANPVESDNTESNVVETFVNAYEMPDQDRLWHTLYNAVNGNFFQYQLSFSPSQMNDPAVFSEPVVIYAVVLWVEKASERLS